MKYVKADGVKVMRRINVFSVAVKCFVVDNGLDIVEAIFECGGDLSVLFVNIAISVLKVIAWAMIVKAIRSAFNKRKTLKNERVETQSKVRTPSCPEQKQAYEQSSSKKSVNKDSSVCLRFNPKRRSFLFI